MSEQPREALDNYHALFSSFVRAALAARQAPWESRSLWDCARLLIRLEHGRHEPAQAAVRLGASVAQAASLFEGIANAAQALYDELEQGGDGLHARLEALRLAWRPVLSLRRAVPSGAPGQGAVHFTADYRSMRWGTEMYTFTPTQAACVQVMARAWENGTPDLSEKEILIQAGAAQEEEEIDRRRLRDLFREKNKPHPAWNTAIKSVRKGTYRIADPPP
jgi:hypothetical protein